MPASDVSDAPALILAAGKGTRMGGPKALMHVGGRPWWDWQSRRLAAAGVTGVWVVSPIVRAAILSAAATDANAPQCLVDGDPDAPMFDSIRAGLEFVQANKPRGVFVLPVDVPAASPLVWQSLVNVADVAAPTCKGVHGHPIWLSWSFLEREVLPAAPDARLDALIGQRTTYIQVEDASVTMNLNTPEDVRAWEQANPATPGNSHR
jgi:CTP:molybdopterin cytidylyltransferase MocA